MHLKSGVQQEGQGPGFLSEPNNTSIAGAGSHVHEMLDHLVAEFDDAHPESSHTQLNNLYEQHKARISALVLSDLIEQAAAATHRARNVDRKMGYFFRTLRGKLTDHFMSEGMGKEARRPKSKRDNTNMTQTPAPHEAEEISVSANTLVDDKGTEEDVPIYPPPSPRASAAWQASREDVLRSLSPTARTWLNGARLLAVDGDTVMVGAVASGMHLTYSQLYGDDLAQRMSEYLGYEVGIKFVNTWRTH
jgi:hypothetical protein